MSAAKGRLVRGLKGWGQSETDAYIAHRASVAHGAECHTWYDDRCSCNCGEQSALHDFFAGVQHGKRLPRAAMKAMTLASECEEIAEELVLLSRRRNISAVALKDFISSRLVSYGEAKRREALEEAASVVGPARFHEAYERLAVSFGVPAIPWASVPEKNKLLMSAVCNEIAEAIRALLSSAETTTPEEEKK